MDCIYQRGGASFCLSIRGGGCSCLSKGRWFVPIIEGEMVCAYEKREGGYAYQREGGDLVKG